MRCVVRGIYHNTMFAKWWSLHPDLPVCIEEAINARCIMNNDLSRISQETKSLPYNIWHPSVPHPSTCLELVRRVPSMKPAVARVCILADYADTWDMIDADPDVILMRDAQESHNPKYLRDLESRVKERGCRGYNKWSRKQAEPRHHMFEYTATCIRLNVTEDYAGYEGVSYNGRQTTMSHVEVSVAISDELKQAARELWERENHIFGFTDFYQYGGPELLARGQQIGEDGAYGDEAYDDDEEEKDRAIHSPTE